MNLHILYINYIKTNSKIIKIQQVHQSYQQNKFEFLDYRFLFVIHLNLK